MAEANWVEIRKSGDFVALGQSLGVNPVVARVLVNRGIPVDAMKSFLYGTIEEIPDAHLIYGMDKLCSILTQKVKERKKIRIIGDYDVDGVCAAYILNKAISRVGGDVSVYLPNRVRDGYGMNMNIVEKCHEDGIDTIITCDNGIAAIDECKRAKDYGMTVLITDHHEVPFHYEGEEKILDIPDADAVVDLKQGKDEYPFREICGAYLAMKVSQVLYEAFGIDDKYEFLEAAAFATIEDVMPLVDENRILVKQGLRLMKDSSNKGIRALIDVCELTDKDAITCYHVGFILGPCINAAGRMSDASIALDLLNADGLMVERKAVQLKALNDERKVITEKGLKEAMDLLGDDIPDVIVAYLPNVPESIIGIIAGRLKESYYRPAIVCTDTEFGLKGSGRSIDGYHLFEKLTECKEMFAKYGGHAAAAGLSIECESAERAKRVEALSQFLNENARLDSNCLREKIEIDAVIPFSYISFDLAEDLKLLEPCGNGMKKPVFAARNVVLYAGRILGNSNRVYKCLARDDSGSSIDAIYFGDEDRIRQLDEICKTGTKIAILYLPQINEYKGSRNLQINIRDFR